MDFWIQKSVQVPKFRVQKFINGKFSIWIFGQKNVQVPQIRTKILLMHKEFSQNSVHAQIDLYVVWEHCVTLRRPQESRKIVKNNFFPIKNCQKTSQFTFVIIQF